MSTPRIARVMLVVLVLFFAVPPMLAFGWTRLRYSQGTVYPGILPRVAAWTSGYANRQYNAAYRSPDICERWRVRYYDTPTHITWQKDTRLQPDHDHAHHRATAGLLRAGLYGDCAPHRLRL
jgi:hypothetical protein